MVRTRSVPRCLEESRHPPSLRSQVQECMFATIAFAHPTWLVGTGRSPNSVMLVHPIEVAEDTKYDTDVALLGQGSPCSLLAKARFRPRTIQVVPKWMSPIEQTPERPGNCSPDVIPCRTTLGQATLDECGDDVSYAPCRPLR
eukprot:14110359-Alexandrium_andersonii.AAC.1